MLYMKRCQFVIYIPDDPGGMYSQLFKRRRKRDVLKTLRKLFMLYVYYWIALIAFPNVHDIYLKHTMLTSE
jgi:hypothetical protein